MRKISFFSALVLGLLVTVERAESQAFDPRAAKSRLCFPSHMKSFMRAKAASLDPNDIMTFMDNQIAMAVYGQLTTLDEYENVKPDLAKSWQVSADGRTIQFELRSGLKFSDGTSLESEDVVYSFHRLFSPKLKNDAARYLFGDGIEGIDEYMSGKTKFIRGISSNGKSQVTFKLKVPRSNFLTMLAMGPASIVSRSTPLIPTKATSIVSSGPFSVASFSSEKVTAKKNGYYYKNIGIEELEYGFDGRPICEILALKEYAFIDAGPMDKPLCTSEFYAPNMYPGANTWFVAFGSSIDADLRKKITTCAAREVYLKSLSNDKVPSVPRTSLFPKPERASTNIKAAAVDAACRLDKKTTLKLYTSNLYNNTHLADLFSKIKNLEVNIEEVDDSRHRELRKNGKYDLLYMTFNGTFSDPTFESSLFVGTGSILNNSYKNSDYDQAAAQILRARSSSEQRSAISNLEKVISKDPPALFIKQHDNVEWIRKDLNTGTTGWFYRYFAIKTSDIGKDCNLK